MLQMIKLFPPKSNPKRKQKNPPPKTPKNHLGHTSERFFLCDFLGCFKMFWDVLRCFEMFWETSYNQSKPHSKKATLFTKKKSCTPKILQKTRWQTFQTKYGKESLFFRACL